MVNGRNGRKISVHLKTEVYTIKLWVKGERHDKTVTPKSEEPNLVSGNSRQARL